MPHLGCFSCLDFACRLRQFGCLSSAREAHVGRISERPGEPGPPTYLARRLRAETRDGEEGSSKQRGVRNMYTYIYIYVYIYICTHRYIYIHIYIYIWVWVKIKTMNRTADFSPCFPLPRQAILGTYFDEPYRDQGCTLLIFSPCAQSKGGKGAQAWSEWLPVW